MHALKVNILKVMWEVWVVFMFIVKAKLIFRKQLRSVLLLFILRGSQQIYIPVKMSGKIEPGYLWSQSVQIILIHKSKIGSCKTSLPFYS